MPLVSKSKPSNAITHARQRPPPSDPSSVVSPKKIASSVSNSPANVAHFRTYSRAAERYVPLNCGDAMGMDFYCPTPSQQLATRPAEKGEYFFNSGKYNSMVRRAANSLVSSQKVPDDLPVLPRRRPHSVAECAAPQKRSSLVVVDEHPILPEAVPLARPQTKPKTPVMDEHGHYAGSKKGSHTNKVIDVNRFLTFAAKPAAGAPAADDASQPVERAGNFADLEQVMDILRYDEFGRKMLQERIDSVHKAEFLASRARAGNLYYPHVNRRLAPTYNPDSLVDSLGRSLDKKLEHYTRIRGQSEYTKDLRVFKTERAIQLRENIRILKKTQREVSDLESKLASFQGRWLAHCSMAARHVIFLRRFHQQREFKRWLAERHAACRTIQRTYRGFVFLRYVHERGRARIIIRRVLIRFRFTTRLAKARWAVKCLKLVLQDNRRASAIAVAIRHFRRRVIAAQRMCQGWLNVTAARLALIAIQFQRLDSERVRHMDAVVRKHRAATKPSRTTSRRPHVTTLKKKTFQITRKVMTEEQANLGKLLEGMEETDGTIVVVSSEVEYLLCCDLLATMRDAYCQKLDAWKLLRDQFNQKHSRVRSPTKNSGLPAPVFDVLKPVLVPVLKPTELRTLVDTALRLQYKHDLACAAAERLADAAALATPAMKRSARKSMTDSSLPANLADAAASWEAAAANELNPPDPPQHAHLNFYPSTWHILSLNNVRYAKTEPPYPDPPAPGAPTLYEELTAEDFSLKRAIGDRPIVKFLALMQKLRPTLSLSARRAQSLQFSEGAVITVSHRMDRRGGGHNPAADIPLQDEGMSMQQVVSITRMLRRTFRKGSTS